MTERGKVLKTKPTGIFSFLFFFFPLLLAGEGKEELSFGETRVTQSAGSWGPRWREDGDPVLGPETLKPLKSEAPVVSPTMLSPSLSWFLESFL